jgi:hypothetical protein
MSIVSPCEPKSSPLHAACPPPPPQAHASLPSTPPHTRKPQQTTASAFPIAEVANQSIEIATIAVNCFGITLIGLAIGFVLLRVEAAVEGEE